MTMTEAPLTGSVFSEFEVRDLDTTTNLTRLAGLAVPYNKPADVGYFTEEFEPGTFARSITRAGKGMPLLLFHNDRGWPIGVSEEWSDTQEGLRGVWRLDQHEDAQRAARMARDGLLSYMSVKFQQVPGQVRMINNPDKPHFVRSEARLVETSLTSTPVYIDSTVTWVRAQSQDNPGRNVRQWTRYLDEIRGSV